MAAISPVNFAAADFPPTMLITGNRDDLVDWRDSHGCTSASSTRVHAPSSTCSKAPRTPSTRSRHSAGSAPGSWRSFWIATCSTRNRSSSRVA